MYSQQPTYNAPAQEKVTNPFWFRDNKPYLAGVTNLPSNPMLGIQNITLKEASPAQIPHGFLYNGMLATAIGSVWFQIRVSKNGAPMVTTESRKTGQDATTGKDKYFEPTMLNPQTKAQILRHMEAVRSAQFAQAQQFQQPQFGQQPQYQQLPQQPMYQTQVPQYQAQVPQYQAHVPVQQEQTYQPPAGQPAVDVAGTQELVGAGAPVPVGDDDLPF